MTNPTSIKNFISRWEASGAAERANYQLFLAELCDLLVSLGQARQVDGGSLRGRNSLSHLFVPKIDLRNQLLR